MRLSLAFFFTFIFSASGAVRGKLKDELTQYRSEIAQIGAKIKSLEADIQSKNHLHQSSLSEIRTFESEIQAQKDELKAKQDLVAKRERDQKNIIKNFLLHTTDEAGSVVQKRIHLSLMKQSLEKITQEKLDLESYLLRVSEFDAKLAELKKNEEDLQLVIQSLEEKKRLTQEIYEKKLEKKVTLQGRIDKKILEKKSTEIQAALSEAPVFLKRAERVFSSPLLNFISRTGSAKGVTFKYDSVQAVKSPGEGKVVFAGDLSNYGQVVMIDHGNDLRTVILGRLDLKIKKEDEVSSDQIIGYTQLVDQASQNLYFEVRKKNTAQNTILWLASEGTSKI